jgi:hypothetical protein
MLQIDFLVQAMNLKNLKICLSLDNMLVKKWSLWFDQKGKSKE